VHPAPWQKALALVLEMVKVKVNLMVMVMVMVMVMEKVMALVMEKVMATQLGLVPHPQQEPGIPHTAKWKLKARLRLRLT
jgi:hypothetical protein